MPYRPNIGTVLFATYTVLEKSTGSLLGQYRNDKNEPRFEISTGSLQKLVRQSTLHFLFTQYDTICRLNGKFVNYYLNPYLGKLLI